MTECSVENCEAKHFGRGYCQKHYAEKIAVPRQREQRAAARRAVPQVVADCAWVDVVRGGPTGQKVALYTCPACGKQHLCAWLPVDDHPGLKLATCRATNPGSNATNPMFKVFAPLDGRLLQSPPDGYAPVSGERLSVADVNAALSAVKGFENGDGDVAGGFESERGVNVA